MNVISFLTTKGYSSFGSPGEWEISSNPFFMERDFYGTFQTKPNWAFIIPFIAVCLAILITVAVLFYRSWRKKNCHPIYFAGKVRYARKGLTIQSACQISPIYGDNWIKIRHRELIAEGLRVKTLYTDSALTVPLDQSSVVTAPVYIYPKIEN